MPGTCRRPWPIRPGAVSEGPRSYARGVRVIEIDRGSTIWRFDADFFNSRWTCIWGRGCLGIEDEPAPEAGRGCCSVGAELEDEHEARMIAALAATLKPERFEHHGDAQAGGIFRDDERNATRVLDGACIFL